MRVPFSDVFQDNGDGSYTPKVPVQIGGVSLGTGVSFRPGVSFSGIDIAQYAGHDLDVNYLDDGTAVINGVFK